MIRWLAACLMLVAFVWPAGAAELKVLSAGAFNAVAVALVPGFQSATGHKVTLRNDTVGGLVRHINGGEAFDVVLMSPEGLQELAKTGKIVSGSVITLARVGIGVGVKAGTTLPDISSVPAFRAAMLNAHAIAYIDPASGGSSGIYLAKLFQTMGIADAMAAKSVLVKGGLAADTLRDGRAEMALQQISEIIAVPGVALVGPLPAEIQHETIYAGAIAAGSPEPDAARAFLTTLSGAAARPVLAAKGMMPP